MSDDAKIIGGALAFGALGFLAAGAAAGGVAKASTLALAQGALQGATLGATIGAAFTTTTLDPQVGNRVEDLTFQESTYGKFIPRTYGKDRLAGNVFWLENNKIEEIETTREVELGKGREQVVTEYTYKASFAVGLCEGPIEAIDRIWLDGTLIYSNKPLEQDELEDELREDLKEVGELLYSDLRIYNGTQDQEVDALIEADQTNSPAYRNTAYIVFEDLYLGYFGNRIPTVTVETVSNRQNNKVQGIINERERLLGTFDGSNWVDLSIPLSPGLNTYGIYDITHDNGVWLASQITSPSTNRIARSVDGVNWISTYDPPNDFYLQSRAVDEEYRDSFQFVGNNTWYAIAGYSPAGGTIDDLSVHKSTDNGVSWSQVGYFDISALGFSGYVMDWAYKGNEEWYVLTNEGDLLLLDTGGTNLTYVNTLSGSGPSAKYLKVYYLDGEIWVWAKNVAGGTYDSNYIWYAYSTDGGTTWQVEDNQPYIVSRINNMFKSNGYYYSLTPFVINEGKEGNSPGFEIEYLGLIKHDATFTDVTRIVDIPEARNKVGTWISQSDNGTVNISVPGTPGVSTIKGYMLESVNGLDGPYVESGSYGGNNQTFGYFSMREDYIKAFNSTLVYDTIVGLETDSNATAVPGFVSHDSGIMTTFSPRVGSTSYFYPPDSGDFWTPKLYRYDTRTYDLVSESVVKVSSSYSDGIFTAIPFSDTWAINHNNQGSKSPLGLLHLPTGSVYHIASFNLATKRVYNSGNNNFYRHFAVANGDDIYIYYPARWQWDINGVTATRDYSIPGIVKVNVGYLEPTERKEGYILAQYFDSEANSSFINPAAMGVDSATGEIYAYTTTDGNDRILNRIDPNTGIPTELGTIHTSGATEIAHLAVYDNYHYTIEVNDNLKSFELVTRLIDLQDNLVKVKRTNISRTVFPRNNFHVDSNYLFICPSNNAEGSREQFNALPNPVKVAGYPIYKNNNCVLEAIIKEEVAKSDIIKDSDVKFTGLPIEPVKGFTVANAKTIKTILQPLTVRFNLLGREKDYQIEFLDRSVNNVVATVEADDLQAHEPGQDVPDQITIQKPPAFAIPSRLEIDYKDVNKDYESNTQFIENLTTNDNVNVEKISLSMVMSADEAAQTADTFLQRRILESQGVLSFVTHSGFSYISPGDQVTVNTDNESYTIEVTSIDVGKPGLVKVTGAIYDSDIFTSLETGETGLTYTSTFPNVPPSIVVEFETPPLSVAADDFGYYYLTYPLKNQDNWNGAVTYKSSDGANYSEIGFNSTIPSIGTCTDTLSGNMLTGVFDSSETLNVQLFSGELSSVTETVLRNDEGNVFAYGVEGRWEIIKAQNVTLEADGTYTLSKFVRGYLNTEYNMDNHEVGDQLILLDSSYIGRVANTINNYTNAQYLKAVSVGRQASNAIEIQPQVSGLAQKPASVAHARAERESNNDWTFDWIRRARINWEWNNSSDVPLDMPTEKYVVRIVNADPYNGIIAEDGLPEAVRTIEVTDATTATYTEAQQIADWGSVQSVIYALIYQVNDNWGIGEEVLVTKDYS